MKNSELIRLAKDKLVSLMANDTIESASTEMAKILFLHNEGYTTDEDVIKLKNLFGVSDSNGKMKFKTCAESIEVAIKGNISYGTILDTKFKKSMASYVKGNHLGRLDRDALAKKKMNIVDLPNEKKQPKVDVYTVKEENKEILKTASLDQAKEVVKKKPAAKVYDSRARIVTVNAERRFAKNIKTKAYIKGTTIECNNVHLYYKLDDVIPGRVISGTYYLITGNLLRGGRYAVCKSMDNPKCIGYISRAQILRETKS